MKISILLASLSLFTVGTLSSVTAQGQKRGVEGLPAGEWGATHWIQLPEGKKNLSAKDYEGKVLYLYCFQSWCPGCHKHGFPTLKALTQNYAKTDDVAFVSIQTVFEGHGSNPPSRVAEMAKRYGLKIPMGHSGTSDKRSVLMSKYRTGGTPWTIIIDKKGVVRFNDFHISQKNATELIEKLRKE